jgi:dihydrofolate synthase/folylpolyglutamate synthase
VSARGGDGLGGDSHDDGRGGGGPRGGGRGGGGRASAGRPTGRSSDESWSGERAERHLRSLELFGMRFGLDRMRRMMTVLGSPQRRFRAVHVVGTNGKTSTTRMVAAILERHGLRTGAYLSPHLISYAERVQVAERDLSGPAFAAAVARAAWAAERVNRTLAEDDHVTQFELLTAAALWALAEREVEVAVVEAGLGGRYDATAVVESAVTVLTNVGLEHTRWLGPTVRDIATEKLAVLRPGTALALGADLDSEALAVAGAVAGEQRARIVQVSPEEVAAAPPAPIFQQRNFALARVAAEAYLADAGIAVREEAVREAALATDVPGRLQVVADDPLTVLDAAHNPDAARALVESLPALLVGRRLADPIWCQPAHEREGGFDPQLAHVVEGGSNPQLALVMGVLEDKDAASMLSELLPLCARAWFTAPPSSRALSPAALQSLARQQGFEHTACEPHPRRALEQAREWARAQPGATAVLATGSVYLVGDLLACFAERAAALGDVAATGAAEGRA